MVNIVFPAGTRDEEWLRFFGSIRPFGNDVELRPAEDEMIRIQHLAVDIFTWSDPTSYELYIFVRKGAVVISIQIAGSNYAGRLVDSARSSQQCGGASKCLGNVEYCCGAQGRAVGNCYGQWKCPGAGP